MDAPTYFIDFLNAIRPDVALRTAFKLGHRDLRKQLTAYSPLKGAIVSTFLQGSYRRATALAPQGARRADVDIIVVTRLHEDDYPDPSKVIDLFVAFAKACCAGTCQPQGRSVGIKVGDIDIDLVPTAAPSEAQVGILESESVTDDEDLEEATDWRLNKLWLGGQTRALRNDAKTVLAAARTEPEWKTETLRIPDALAGTWEHTHPLAQLQWTRDKNARCEGHFVNVVKALKWWRNEKLPTLKHPKGFPLERLIGECCPDGIESVGEGVAKTLDAAVAKFALYRTSNGVPPLADYGVPSHNVLKRIDGASFAALYDAMVQAAPVANAARAASELPESVRLWRELFGETFPPLSTGGGGGVTGGYTPRPKVSEPRTERFG